MKVPTPTYMLYNGWYEIDPAVRHANFYLCQPAEVIGPRVIHDFQLLCVQSGKGEVQVDGQSFPAIAGDLFFYGPGEVHRITSDGDDPLRLIGLHVVFQRTDLPALRGVPLASPVGTSPAVNIACPLSPRPPVASTPSPETFRLAQQLALSYTAYGQGDAPRQRALVLLLLTEWLSQLGPGPQLMGSVIRPVRQAQAILHSEFCSPITRDDLARRVSLSPEYFSRLFRRVTGSSFHDYLTDLRLSHARRLLLEGELTITEIARRVGFEDPYYFSRVFRERVGCSPSEYRRGYWPSDHESPGGGHEQTLPTPERPSTLHNRYRKEATDGSCNEFHRG